MIELLKLTCFYGGSVPMYGCQVTDGKQPNVGNDMKTLLNNTKAVDTNQESEW